MIKPPLWGRASDPAIIEWTGRGSDAVVYVIGHLPSSSVEALRDEEWRYARTLGVDLRALVSEHGWVGCVDDDIILDACDEHGRCLDPEPGTGSDQCDEDSVIPVTFFCGH